MDSTSPTYAICASIYGRGDISLGDRPSHMGLAVYELGSSTCEMHQIRCPDDDAYFYLPQVKPLEDSVLRGRCELARFSTTEKDRIVKFLAEFGNDSSNIPEMGLGNCQTWLVAALAAMDKDGIFPLQKGEWEFWKKMVNLPADRMGIECRESGRVWFDGPGQVPFEGVPDARFNDREERNVGTLASDPAMNSRIEAILQSNVNSNS